MAQQSIISVIIENLKKALFFALIFGLVVTANAFPPEITHAQFSDGEEEEEIVENPNDTDFSDGEEEDEPVEDTPDDTDFSDGEEDTPANNEPEDDFSNGEEEESGDTDFSNGEEEEDPANDPDDTDFSEGEEEEEPADNPVDNGGDTDFSDGEEEESSDDSDDTDFSDGEEEETPVEDDPVDDPADDGDDDTDFSDGEEEPADESDDTDFSDGDETPEAAEITNITVSKTVINEADAGEQFFVGVVFNTLMDTTVNPVVSFIPDVSSTLSFVSGAWNTDGTIYTATFDVADSGTEFTGIDVMITGAVDVNAQAVAQDMIIDAFNIDMIAPVVALAYDPDGVVFGNSFVTVTASLSEALVNTPQIGIDAPGENSDVSEADFTATDDILVWTFVWGLQDTGEGVANLTVTGQDTGGNDIATVINDTKTIGATPAPEVNAPTVTSLVISDSLITESDTGTTVTLTATFDSEMATNVSPTFVFSPSLNGTLGDGAGVWSENNTIYTLTYTVVDTDIEISGVDISVSGAQNTDEAVMVSRTFTDIFEIDMRGPDGSFTYTPDKTLNANDIVRITMTLDEVLQDGFTPQIRISTQGDGGLQATHMTATDNPRIWIFDWNVPDGSDENGAATITVDVVDIHGNASVVTGSRDINNGGGATPPPFVDNDKPVVIAVTPSDTLLSVSDENGVFSVEVTFNEAMNQNVVPAIGFNPGATVVIDNEAGSWTSNNTYTFTYTVRDSEVEITDFVATITGAEDVNNNVMDSHTTASLFDVDTVAPTVTLAYTPDVTPVGNGDVVLVSATMSESLSGTPKISVTTNGDGDTSPTDMTAVNGNTLAWTFNWNVPDGSDENGTAVLNVTGTDAAGNGVTVVTNNERTISNVVGDVTPANITSLTVSDTEISESDAGQQFTVTVTFDEVMNENITPVISFLPDVTGVLVADSTDWMNQSSIFRATYIITDNDTEVIDVDVRMDGAEDLAGNVSSHLAVDKFDIDLRGPLVTIEFVPGATPFEAGDAILVVATFDETPSNTPQISIATNGDGDTALTDMIPTQNNPLRFTFTWLVPSGADEDGTATVMVTGTDSAGNSVRGMLNNTATIDNTPGGGGGGGNPGDTTAPLVATLAISDPIITESDSGNIVTVTTTFNEAMNQNVAPTIAFSENIVTTLIATGTPAWLSNTQYQVAYEVADVNVERENIAVIVSGAQDVAGNTMTQFTSPTDALRIDTIAPSIFLAYNPDNILTGSSTVLVTATVSEVLSAEPTLVITTAAGVDVDTTFVAVQGDPLTYTFEWDVPEGNQHNGEVNLIVRATDVLGNTNVDEATNNTREINNPISDPVPDPDPDPNPTPDPDPQPQPQPPSGGGGGGGGGGGAAPAFSNPLSVFDFRATRIAPDVAVVTWTSNLSATRQVFYGTESVPERVWTEKFGYQFETEKNEVILENHSVLLTGLDSQQNYYVRGASNLPGNREVFTSEVLVPAYGGITSDDVTLAGSQCSYLFDFLGSHLDTNNIEEVQKLQTFLNQFEGEALAITAQFDEVTIAAVKRFQTKYRADILDPWGTPEATGFVYITTKKKINEIVCGEVLNFTAPESAEIEAYKNRGTLEVAETPDVIGGLRPASPTDVVTVPTTDAKSLKVKGYDVDALLIPAPNAETTRKERFILPGSVIHSIPGLLFFR